MTARVCVLILAYNQFERTRACLRALAGADSSEQEIVVIDNASTDGTAELLADEFPNVCVLINTTNVGYAKGNNLGVQFALDRHFEYAMILNNDVTVDAECIECLVKSGDENSNAALLGPMVYHANEPEVIQSAGGVLPADWHSFHRGENQVDRGQFSTIEAVDWLTGCAVLTRTSALRKFGLLDPDFFMYGEDVDWGVRARDAGFQVLFVPQARVWHSGVEREYVPAPYVTYYSARNELQLIQKHRAGIVPYAKSWLRHARTIASWSLQPRWRGRREQRNALARAMRDVMLHRTGSAF